MIGLVIVLIVIGIGVGFYGFVTWVAKSTTKEIIKALKTRR